MRLSDLLTGVNVVERRGSGAPDVRSIAHDSRATTPGALYCCIPGEHSDGHDFAADAVSRGAVALVVERFCDVDVPQVRVASVRDVIGALAARLYGDPSRSLRLIGVTGTNGKTTTTYLLDAVARAAGAKTGLVGTIATRVGDVVVPQPRTTPEAPELQALFARMVDEGVEAVAIEVSSHALTMGRVRGTRFASVAFTNLGRDHLDFHADLEDYFAAKASLFTPEYASCAAINLDDARGAALAASARSQGIDVWTVRSGGTGSETGRSADADIVASSVSASASSTVVALAEHRGARHAEVESNLVGSFNVANIGLAAGAALAAGYGWDEVVAGVSEKIVVPGRLERVGEALPVFVDYAHTPDALTAVTAALRPIVGRTGRLIVVFGAGGDRDRAKRPAMGRAVAQGAEVLVVTSDNPRSEDPDAIIDDVVRGVDAPGVDLRSEPDRRSAIRLALELARPGDVVLVAGKGHETTQTAGGVTVAFDDREVVREELEALGCA